MLAFDGVAGGSRHIFALFGSADYFPASRRHACGTVGAGQPTEGVGLELFAIASVVVGGTLLTGGQGSVITTLAGVLSACLIFNILNFENVSVGSVCRPTGNRYREFF